MPNPITTSTLFYGDNLHILREYLADESVDLIYLDPPFNSNRNYNVLFKDESGHEAEAQIEAFEDTWHWNEARAAYDELVASGPIHVSKMIESLHDFIGASQMMAYLVMMAARLVELHRVLKPTGSLYLHCDPVASHYLKVVLDTIFGAENYRNEISWRRSNPKSQGTNNFANCRDVILRYSKSNHVTFNPIYGEHDPEYLEKAYHYFDEKGRRYRLLPLLNPNDDRPNLTYEFLGVKRVWRWTKARMEKAYADGLVVQLKPGAVPQYKKYLDESKGRTISNDWNDIEQAAGNEVLGYPTQKPLALLERIINASSNAGDIVFDPFCGCGTTIAAAQKLGRTWIGIDVTYLALHVVKKRLRQMFPDAQFTELASPRDVHDAHQLALKDRYQFQWWALDLAGASPRGAQAGAKEGKKGADKGIDGWITFIDDNTDKAKRILIQVKSGKVERKDIATLHSDVQRERAVMGVLVTLEPPTHPMRDEVSDAGQYHSSYDGKNYPMLQVVSIEELLNGAQIKMPPSRVATYKQAQQIRKTAPEKQKHLDMNAEQEEADEEKD